MNEKVTFLGPVGATFSHDAYTLLADRYGAPKAIEAGEHTNCVPATTNGEILTRIKEHGGYGAIAMETFAEGRVAEPLESFIKLLPDHHFPQRPAFHIIGAVNLNIHFCLMVKPGMSKNNITKILLHPKALGPCRINLKTLGVPIIHVSSNGEAARLIAEDPAHSTRAALGPESAAERYGLDILCHAFEDLMAVTTFFLIGPESHGKVTGANNRVLIVFKTQHEPGFLVKCLQPFADEKLNLVQIHSMHAGHRTYHFAIELELMKQELHAFDAAMEKFKATSYEYLCFGPFEVA